MKYDISTLTQMASNAKGCLLGKQQHINVKGRQYRTWPLFFSDSFNNSDVDVCTSGLGVVALSKFDYQNDRILLNSIFQSVNTILSIRNDDGSWPSKISLVSNDNYSMEGVISDIYYAVSALLCVGFLNNNSGVSGFMNIKTGEILDTLDKRIQYIEKSIEWLLENRVENNQGWQYTGVRYLENPTDKELLPAYTMPTANAIVLLSKTKEALEQVNSSHPLISKINDALISSINWLCVVQSSDCGFGIKRGDSSRLSNTAKVIVALSEITSLSDSLQKKVDELLKKAVNWLTKSYKPNKISFSDVSEDFTQVFIELDKASGSIKNAFRRSIIHETYLEPLLIDALYAYYKKSKSTIKSFQKRRLFFAMDKALSLLLSSQNQTGELSGAVASRRQTDSEKFTMYSTCDFISTIKRLMSDEEMLKKISHSGIVFRFEIGVVAIIALLALGLPIIVGKESYIYTIPSSLILGIIINAISGKIL